MNEKRVIYDWDALLSLSDVRSNVLALSDRDIAFLVTAIPVSRWETRWVNVALGQRDARDAYVADVIKAMTVVDICQLVADCIRNDEGVQSALDDWASGGLPPPSGGNTPNEGVPEDTVLVSCDLNSIYGSAVAIEDYIHTIAQDVVELVVASPGAIAAALRLIDYLPIIGDFPVADDLNDLVTWLQVNGSAAFAAGYDATIRQANICGLYERACDDCELSVQDILLFYAGGAGIGISLDDPFRTLAVLLTGTVADTAFVAGVHALVCAAIAAGSSVGGIVGLEGFRTIAASGEPDDDWQLFCDPCPQPESCAFPLLVNFDTGGYPPCVSSFQGSIQDAGNPDFAQRQVGSGSSNTIGAGVWIDLPAPVTSLEVDYQCYGTVSSGQGYAAITYYFSGSTFITAVSDSVDPAQLGEWVNKTASYSNPSQPINRVRIFIAHSSGSQSQSRDMRLDNISISTSSP